MLELRSRRLRLGRGVGPGLPNDRGDVTQIEAVLDHLGRLPKDEESGRMRPALQNALRITQERFGLKGDGLALPGGPTERLLNALIAGGVSALRPHVTEVPDSKTFEDRLKLSGTVGPEGDNHASDRRWLKSALGVLGHLKLGETLSDDLDDERMGDAIESLNRRHGFPDGRTLRPGSRGEALARNAMLRTFAAGLPHPAGSEGQVPTRPAEHAEERTGTQVAQAESATSDEEAGSYLDLNDPALGAWDASDADAHNEALAGHPIPAWKKTYLRTSWGRWNKALNDADINDTQRFVMREIFTVEGGLASDGSTVAGIQEGTINDLKNDPRVGPSLEDIPTGTKPKDLTDEQRIRVYDAYFSQQYVGFRLAGGFASLHRIGDQQVAAAVADPLFRLGGTGAVVGLIQDTIIDVLADYPKLKSEIPTMTVDRKLGSNTVEALRLIASDPAARSQFLNSLADARGKYMLDHPESGWLVRKNGELVVSDGDKARMNHFRYQ